MIKWIYNDPESIEKLTDEELNELDYELMEAMITFRKADLTYTEEMIWLIRILSIEFKKRGLHNE